MNLFPDHISDNLLPFEGTVNYFGQIMSSSDANRYFDLLLETIDWKNDEVIIFGKHHITKRKTAWYGDRPFDYKYSNTTRTALYWTGELLKLKELAENISGETYNSCLLNLYHDGNEGMGWHSDDEKTIAKDSAILSMSFGAERKFSFRHKKTKETLSLQLEHGSLLIMKDETQTHWLHSIPKSLKIKSPRVNLTFRAFVG